MIDHPERYRLRNINQTWYVESTRTVDGGTYSEPRPEQIRYFTPLAEMRGGLTDGTLLKDTGRISRGNRNLYLFEPVELDADALAAAPIYGRPGVGIWGDEQGVMMEKVPIPLPKTKREVRWSRGHWQEKLKNGWRDIPYEWIDSETGTTSHKKRKPKPASKRPRPRLLIDSPATLSALALLEGDAWLARQQLDSKHLRDSHGFYLNREAHQILVGLGDQRLGLQLDDLVPGSGLIEGLEGRIYAVSPDGEVILLGETADATFVRRVKGVLRVAGA